MAKFLTELDARLINDDSVWMLDSPLVYQSDIVGKITVPEGFQTDFASVPRLPIVFSLYGDKAHRESVIHDYLYRIDSIPNVFLGTANRVFFEAMSCRGKSAFIRYPMYWGVEAGGTASYHKRKVGDSL